MDLNTTSRIKILLVDDIPEARANIKKLLTFEQDFHVVGMAGTGREGVLRAQELQPDIIMMDINMPDIDGIEATRIITSTMPHIGVIMMSVQNDESFLRRSMLAGARHYLTKPVNMDELYDSIRVIYQQLEPIHQNIQESNSIILEATDQIERRQAGDRPGHIITVYSPNGGVGTSTIAVNLAATLVQQVNEAEDDRRFAFGTHKPYKTSDNHAVLLVDSDLQWGSIGVLLNLKPSSTLTDIILNSDATYGRDFESYISKYNNGINVLPSPVSTDDADKILDKYPDSFMKMLTMNRGRYDYIVADTSVTINKITSILFEHSSAIVIVLTPSLPVISNARVLLDLLQRYSISTEKVLFVLNKMPSYPPGNRLILTETQIERFLKHKISVSIAAIDEQMLLRSVTKGITLVEMLKNRWQTPISQFYKLAEEVNKLLNREVITQLNQAHPSEIRTQTIMARTLRLRDRENLLNTQPLLLHLVRKLELVAGGSTAHDIRSPLGAARNSLETARNLLKSSNQLFENALDLIDVALFDANSFLNLNLAEPGASVDLDTTQLLTQVAKLVIQLGVDTPIISDISFPVSANPNNMLLVFYNILVIASAWPETNEPVLITSEDVGLIFHITGSIPSDANVNKLTQLAYFSSVDKTGTRLYIVQRLLHRINSSLNIRSQDGKVQIIVSAPLANKMDWTLGELEHQEQRNDSIEQQISELQNRQLSDTEEASIDEIYEQVVLSFCGQMIAHLLVITQRLAKLQEQSADPKFIQKALRNIRYCEMLIRNLRLAVAGVEPHLSSINLRSITRSASELLERKADDAHIEIVQDVPNVNLLWNCVIRFGSWNRYYVSGFTPI